MVWYGLVWFSMVWSGLEGSKSTTISQSLSDEGGNRAARAAKKTDFFRAGFPYTGCYRQYWRITLATVAV